MAAGHGLLAVQGLWAVYRADTIAWLLADGVCPLFWLVTSGTRTKSTVYCLVRDLYAPVMGGCQVETVLHVKRSAMMASVARWCFAGRDAVVKLQYGININWQRSLGKNNLWNRRISQ